MDNNKLAIVYYFMYMCTLCTYNMYMSVGTYLNENKRLPYIITAVIITIVIILYIYLYNYIFNSINFYNKVIVKIYY